MAKHADITFAAASPSSEAWQPVRGTLRTVGKTLIAALDDLVRPDHALLTACTDFRRADAVLGATPYEDEQAADLAWAGRQVLADRIANLRPHTDAGRRAKAAVALTLLQEVQPWQRDSELMFALAAFRAEAA